MNSQKIKQIKKSLIDRELSIAEIARALQTGDQKESALRVMISSMIHGRRYYPALAALLQEQYGIYIPKPRQLRRAA